MKKLVVVLKNGVTMSFEFPENEFYTSGKCLSDFVQSMLVSGEFEVQTDDCREWFLVEKLLNYGRFQH